MTNDRAMNRHGNPRRHLLHGTTLLAALSLSALFATHTAAAGGSALLGRRTPGIRPAVLSPDAFTWVQTRSGGANTPEGARAVAVDPQGNPVAAGSLADGQGGSMFSVVKRSSSGDFLWQANLSLGAGLKSEATAVGVDNQGNVLAAGYLGGNVGDTQLVAVKLSGADGSAMWPPDQNNGGARYRVFPGGGQPGSRQDRALAMALDTPGNAVVVGRLGPTGAGQFVVAKFINSDGVVSWSYVPAQGIGEARAVAVDSSGSAAQDDVIVGGAQAISGNPEAYVVKLDGQTGAPVWTHTVSSGQGGGGAVNTVVLDSGDDVIAGGTVSEASGDQGLVVKLDGPGGGGELWQRRPTGADSGGNSINAVGADGQNDVLATGGLSDSGGRWTVLKFDAATGAPLWKTPIVNQGSEPGDGSGLAIDGVNNVVVSGYTSASDETFNFTAAKLDPQGAVVWQRTYDGSSNSNDSAYAVALDSAGNVSLAGQSFETPDGAAFTMAYVDEVPPVFSGPLTTNGQSVPSQGGPVLISVPVTDNQTIDSVSAIIHRPDGQTVTVPLTSQDAPVYEGVYQAPANGSAQPKIYTIDLQALDTTGNQRTRTASAGDRIVVQGEGSTDTQAPRISNVKVAPRVLGPSGGVVQVQAEVRDNRGVASVSARFRPAADVSDIFVVLSPTKSPNQYVGTATLPANEAPTAAVYTVSITATDTAENSHTEGAGRVTVRGLAAHISVSAPALDFGRIHLHYYELRRLTIRNTGTDTLFATVTLPEPPFELRNPPFQTVAPLDTEGVPPNTYVLQPGESATAVVRFIPPRQRKYRGALVFRTNDADRPRVRVELTGEGCLPH